MTKGFELEMDTREKINWTKIDNILLDMDGTILDLSFDDYIWNYKIPENLAKVRNLDLKKARAFLKQKMVTAKSTLNWYSFNYWQSNLDIDIDSIEEKNKEKIRYREDTLFFLKSKLFDSKRSILVTNADKQGLNRKLKITGLGKYFQTIVCSHDLGHAKEEQLFWEKLRVNCDLNFNRTLLIDDNLQVLETAKKIGIRYLRGISKPNSQANPTKSHDYILIDKLKEVLD